MVTVQLPPAISSKRKKCAARTGENAGAAFCFVERVDNSCHVLNKETPKYKSPKHQIMKRWTFTRGFPEMDRRFSTVILPVWLVAGVCLFRLFAVQYSHRKQDGRRVE